MDCQVCSEEIPDDSLFCPECGARQDPSKSGAMGGRNFGVVSSQAVQATHDMQASDAAGGTNVGADPSFLNQIANQMGDVPYTYADISKAKNDLDYEPKVSLREGLKFAFNDILKNDYK